MALPFTRTLRGHRGVINWPDPNIVSQEIGRQRRGETGKWPSGGAVRIPPTFVHYIFFLLYGMPCL